MSTLRAAVSAAAPAASRRAAQPRRAAPLCAKKDLHPDWTPEAKGRCNGEEEKVVSGTKDEYVVDVWSGNHPVFQGGDQSLIIEAGQLNKFDDKWGDMGEFAGDLKTINDK